MIQYRVTFDLYEMEGSARKYNSNTVGLETYVNATSPSQAQAMVEVQYGGRDRVLVRSTVPQ
jgi:hypothetical protein